MQFSSHTLVHNICWSALNLTHFANIFIQTSQLFQEHAVNIKDCASSCFWYHISGSPGSLWDVEEQLWTASTLGMTIVVSFVIYIYIYNIYIYAYIFCYIHIYCYIYTRYIVIYIDIYICDAACQNQAFVGKLTISYYY